MFLFRDRVRGKRMVAEAFAGTSTNAAWGAMSLFFYLPGVLSIIVFRTVRRQQTLSLWDLTLCRSRVNHDFSPSIHRRGPYKSFPFVEATPGLKSTRLRQ